ncbi:MAG: hypothetical protein IJG83_00290 [Thermoguttaceae bacterium]|nr:hypothetical protein [Thermoguttaceae bacterium]
MSFITSHLTCHIVFYICLPITFLAIFGFCRSHSLWDMAVKTFCVLFATLFALCLYEPLANLLDSMTLEWAFFNDMWALLLVFGIVLAIEVYATNFISKINVQLPSKAHRPGAFVMIGIFFLGFYSTSALLFYYTIPEKPDLKAVDIGAGGQLSINVPPQFLALEFLSKGSLSGKQQFDFSRYFENHFNRRCAVYSQVDADVRGSSSSSSGVKAAWTFQGSSSPNKP